MGWRIRNRIVPCLFLIGIGFYGCSEKEPGRYYNGDGDFSIMLPEDWEMKEGLMGTAVISLSPQENSGDQFRENLNVSYEDLPGDMSAEEYFKLSEPAMTKMLTAFQQYENGRVSINEADAKWIIYGHSMGNLNLKVLTYFLVNNGRGYVITCSSTPEQFSNFKKKFQKIADTFQFE